MLPLILCCVFFSAHVGAQNTSVEDEFYFSIPRLSADQALIRFAKQAEITLLFPYNDVKKFKTRPLNGRFTVYDGLRFMLSGTDIEISAGVGNDLRVSQENDASSELQTPLEDREMNNFGKRLLPGAITLAVATTTGITTAQAQQDQSETIEEVMVLGSRSVKARSAADSPVPVDVISGDDFSALGQWR